MAKKSSMQMMADAIAPTKPAKAASTKPEVETTKVASEVVAKADDAAVAATVPAAAEKPAKAPKEPKGPVKIETCGQLLKALWSSRGLVFISVPSFPVPLAVVKNVMTTYLQSGDLAAPAPYDLVAREDNTGSDLIPRV